MTTPLVVVTGTGTGIGKTFIASALVVAWAQSRGGLIAGVKPIESGGSADVVALGQVSTFHVTRFTPPYLLMDPVSPHLAARRDSCVIDLTTIATWIAEIRSLAHGVVVELAGGLFTPLRDDGVTNADLVRLLHPTHCLLVAPDRLGVLHDVIATTTAARASNTIVSGIVLSSPNEADITTGTNTAELGRLLADPPVLLTVPRTTFENATTILTPLITTMRLSEL